MECYYLLEDYDKLGALIEQIPENSLLLEVQLTASFPGFAIDEIISPKSFKLLLLEHFMTLCKPPKPPHEPRPLPQNIASKCASVGMCGEASKALVKCGMVKEAVDCCVALNQWNLAVEIAHENNMSSVDELLAKYAAHLLEKGNWEDGKR